MNFVVHMEGFVIFVIDLCLMVRGLIWQTVYSAMTKIVGTLGPKSRSVEIISDCLKAGMSGTKCLTFSGLIVLYLRVGCLFLCLCL